jgi:16S rRNA (guanine966-N2)-methyltransferase
MAELRIVAGEWRGRRIAVPPGQVRPTPDRVREAWMSIVLAWLDGARVLDLCAGSGALGLEALSRGATRADFVEREAGVIVVLRRNIATLGAEARAHVHRGDAVRFVAKAAGSRWDVAFADPPYADPTAERLAERWIREPFATIFGVEHPASRALPDPVPGQAVDRRAYGDTAITLYRMEG